MVNVNDPGYQAAVKKYQAAYKSGEWGPDYAAYGDYFRQNRIGPYDQTAPLKIYQGDADDTVPEWGTHAVVDARNGRRLAIIGDLLETYRLIHTRAAEADRALRLALGPIRPRRHPDRRHRPR